MEYPCLDRTHMHRTEAATVSINRILAATHTRLLRATST